MDKTLWEDPLIARYFKLNEFDSPDAPGSGNIMSHMFIKKVCKIRSYVDMPFIITSGYRTPEHNQKLLECGFKASKDSAHLKGLACDIKALDSHFLYLLIKYAMLFGIKRIGVGKSFVHIDDDPEKTAQEVIWGYYA